MGLTLLAVLFPSLDLSSLLGSTLLRGLYTISMAKLMIFLSLHHFFDVLVSFLSI